MGWEAQRCITLRFIDALLGSFGSKETVMSGIRFTDEFKCDAVAQVMDRGYSVTEYASGCPALTAGRSAC